MVDYHIDEGPHELSIPEEANERYADPTWAEVCRTEKHGRPGVRVIGGDQGDVYFDSFTVEDGFTVLNGAVLRTAHEDLDEEEAFAMADGIVAEAFASIGTECLH